MNTWARAIRHGFYNYFVVNFQAMQLLKFIAKDFSGQILEYNRHH
jgi:hypothetical protein